MDKAMIVVIATGGFDPLHSGHLEYLKAAQQLGDSLWVGVNSDEWLTRKKGKPFMPLKERRNVLEAIKYVNVTFTFDDSDGTAIDAIKEVRRRIPDCQIIFANGGDRTATNIPEMDCGVDNVTYIFGVGGEDKKNSSSWILQNWKN